LPPDAAVVAGWRQNLPGGFCWPANLAGSDFPTLHKIDA